jgi:rubredoxin
MDESKKKLLLVVVIVVCLGAAGAITLMQTTSDPRNLEQFSGEQVWLKCGNEACGNTWQMNKKVYFEYIEKNIDPAQMTAPPLTCDKCNEQSGFRAEKCAKCGLVFFRGAVPNDYADRCPECKFSQIEEDRRSRSGG